MYYYIPVNDSVDIIDSCHEICFEVDAVIMNLERTYKNSSITDKLIFEEGCKGVIGRACPYLIEATN